MDRSKPASKRKPPAFKPPRPVSKPKKPSAGPSRRKSAPAKPVSVSSDTASDVDIEILDDSFPEDCRPPKNNRDRSPSLSRQLDSSSSLPPKLLTRLLHYSFEREKTRLGKGANELVGKYIDTFVREALARAAYESAQTPGGGKDFLEVEDLEKLAPQLLMDF